MKIEPQQIKAFLLDAGLISAEQFQQAEAKSQESQQKLADILVSEGFVSQEDLIKTQAYILGIPFINLEKTIVELEVLQIIPEPIARTHNIVAFRQQGRNLEVAMLDPEDLKTIDFIKKSAKLKILPRLTTPEGIKAVLRQYAKTLQAEFGEIIQKEAEGVRVIKEDEIVQEKEELQSLATELPVIKIVDALLKHAALERASDIHIEPIEKEVIVRYRIDGILHDAMTLPRSAASGIVARIKVLSDLKLDEHRLPQDGRFKFEVESYQYSVRVSILPIFDGEKIVMRLLPETSQALTLEALGLREEALELIEVNLRKPVGMILITGPTGCGKTTTLYSMLEILNTPEVNISTIEDPIEYRMPRINQTQVRPKIGLTFASGLRALVRQDPDIIMVGEIRDNETASLSINAALTGHLVLSTLHTTSAAGALPRLIDMEAEPFLISSTLNVVLAQRLVRRLCREKERYFLTSSQIRELSSYCNLEQVLKILKQEKLAKSRDTLQKVAFFKPTSSQECEDGYSGRIGIFEVLPIRQTIKELIVREATSDQIQAQGQKEGMRTMLEDGFVKAAQGITSIEEVLRVIVE